MPEISVIIPVYKVEAYLDRCVASIVKQTFKDLEIILVDDGSPDSCPKMCDQWAEKDSRIKVIHKQNGGLSSARNAGMKASSGEYVSFVDSDDWIAPDMYESLLELVKKYAADYVCSEMQIVNQEKIIVQRTEEINAKVMNQDEMFKLFFRVTDPNLHYCVCDKLFSRKVLENITFWEGMRFEDIDFNFMVIQKCKKSVYTNKINYYWFYNNESITRNGVVREDLQLITVWKKIVDICKNNFPQYEYYAKMNYERAHMGLLAKASKYGVSKDYKDWNRDKKYLLIKLRTFFPDLIKWKMPLSRKGLLCVLCTVPSLLFKGMELKNRIEK